MMTLCQSGLISPRAVCTDGSHIRKDNWGPLLNTNVPRIVMYLPGQL